MTCQKKGLRERKTEQRQKSRRETNGSLGEAGLEKQARDNSGSNPEKSDQKGHHLTRVEASRRLSVERGLKLLHEPCRCI
jgi:hypothetical protein